MTQEEKAGKLTEEEIVKLAAKEGAEAGIAAFKKAYGFELSAANDRRLRNTELLLDNYRAFRAASANAVYRAEDCETLDMIIRDLMLPGRAESVTVQSIKKSAARTVVIVQHIEQMLALYKNYCMTSGKDEDRRRWRVVEGLYISENPQCADELARQEHCDVTQIYRDRKNAIGKIAVYMFGIDFVANK